MERNELDNITCIILAAGMGKRMNTNIPKCIVKVLGKEMILRIIDSIKEINIKDILCVLGYKKEEIIKLLDKDINFVIQENQLGTADAIRVCNKYFENKNRLCVIIPGDMAFLDCEIINKLIDFHENEENDLSLVSSYFKDTKMYGKIKRIDNKVSEIIEYKDAHKFNDLTSEVNIGLYCIESNLLFKYINKIKNENNSKEYYLTDLIKLLYEDNYKIDSLVLEETYKLKGINDYETLRELEVECLKS